MSTPQATATRSSGVIALRVRDAAFGYRHRSVIENVSLEIGFGELWFFVGPNGAGKSTLLHGLLATLSPIAGEVLRHPDLRDRRSISFVPQLQEARSALPLNVEEYTALGLVGMHLARSERRCRIDEALDRVQIRDLGRQVVWELSGGQRQRVVLARALARRPRVLFLDEPTINLDLSSHLSLLHLLAEFNRDRQLTILVVTHALATVRRLATRVAVVHSGRVETGPVAEQLTEARVRRVFGDAVGDELFAAVGPEPGR